MAREFEKIVYFVRHGQSEGNLGLVFQASDSPLTELGQKQAKLTAHRVGKLDFDTLIASPWIRAKQTAEFVSELTGKEIVFSELFVERVRPTSSSGKSRDNEQAVQLEALWYESLFNPELRAEDSENYSDVLARADESLAYLSALDTKSAVVVTHGFFLQVIIARVLLGDSLNPDSLRSIQKHMSHENTGITAMVYNFKGNKPGWSLWIFNDHAHLAD